jgi:tRNA threonylcarbamoyladenosine biosynthesis protein TsaB
MTVLAVETSTATASVALVDDAGLIVEEALRLAREHCRQVPCMMARVLELGGVGLAKVDAFAVGVGPGSFTGVRVGVALVNGLSFARAKPTLGVQSLEALAAGAHPQDRPIWAVLDTGRARRDVYWARYECAATGEPQLVDGPGCLPLSALAERVEPPALVVGESVCRRGDAWRVAVAPGVDLGGWDSAWPRASSAGLVALRRLHSGRAPRLGDVTPVYLSAPQVGRRRKAQ